MRTKILLCVLCILMQTGMVNAQSTIKDSLKSLLNTTTADSTRSKILCKLGAQYMISDPDSALLFSRQGLSIAKATGFVEGEITGLNQTASIFNIIGNYPKALHYFLEALQKAEMIQNHRKMGMSLLNIGSVYYYQGDYQTAIIYSLKAKEIFEKLKDNSMIMTVALNLGDYYEKWNRLDSANYFTQQAANLATMGQDIDFIGMSYNNLGNIYSKLGQDDIALDFYRSALKNLMNAGNKDAICECSLGMAKIFANKKMKDSSKIYCNLSVNTALEGGFTNRVHKASGFLSDYFETLGNVDSAFVYLKMFNAAKDSLYNQERAREIQNLIFTESIRQQEKAEELSALKQEQKINIQYGMIGIGIIGFAVFFILISRTIIVNERWVSFLGIMALLLIFEFLNMILHPYIADLTKHSPFFMLMVSVIIAALLIPVHHKGENLIKYKVIEKNKRIRLAAAKRTIRHLDHDPDIRERDH